MSEHEQVLTFTKSTADVINQRRELEATPQIQYVSQGHCLVIGEPERALGLRDQLRTGGMTIVNIDPGCLEPDRQLTEDGIAVFTVPELSLTGYLGAYRATVPPGPQRQATDYDLGVAVFRETGLFDVVLDLSAEPVMPMRLKPFGYRHISDDSDLEGAAQELGDMQGEFEKPRYFNYDEKICAHSRSELEGCHRCIDVCVSAAITPRGEGVSIDPFLCQGCGSCATVCPSGAMSYAYPRPSDAIRVSRETLRDAQARTLILHTEAHQTLVDEQTLGSGVIAMLVEEVSAFGADYWLSVLAGSANRILLLQDWHSDDPNRLAIESQLSWLTPLLEAVNIRERPIRLVSPDGLAEALSAVRASDEQASANAAGLSAFNVQDFDTHNDKRQTIRMALDAFAAQLPPAEPIVALPKGAPFGLVEVDKEACTLCMACVSTCPAKALQDGQDVPALRFVESNCLQCGLCESACPESAISLKARYVWDSVEARKVNTLHDEQPFHCINCHTPFATRSMIENMSEKLSGHWMFQDQKALRRLRLCGDCRVRDMFEDDAAGIAVHKTTE